MFSHKNLNPVTPLTHDVSATIILYMNDNYGMIVHILVM